MGAVSSACEGCFGGDTGNSFKSSVGLPKKYKRPKPKASTLEDLDEAEGKLLKPEKCRSDDENQKQKDCGDQAHQSLSLEDFAIIKTLGKGAFGKVYLVQKKANKKYYALKVLKKKELMMKNLLKSVLNEKNILRDIRHPFIVSLKFSFQNQTRVYMVTDLCIGGDLYKKIKKEGKFDEKIVKFYAAELVLALQYLHEDLNTIHRDIKAENILIASDGHLKVSDFGLAKATTRALSLCGTPDYLAPEIIMGRPYGPAVDWWSFGCLLYQMLTGYTPFGQKEDLIESIMTQQPEMPAYFSSPTKDLLRKLLTKEPKERLGYKGAEEIKNHHFFKGIDWKVMFNKEISPPFKALTPSPDMGSHITPSEGSALETPFPDLRSQNNDNIYFSKFSYVGRETLVDIQTK